MFGVRGDAQAACEGRGAHGSVFKPRDRVGFCVAVHSMELALIGLTSMSSKKVENLPAP